MSWYAERYRQAVHQAEQAENDYRNLLRLYGNRFFHSGLNTGREVSRYDAMMQALSMPDVKDALWDHRFAVDKAVMYGLGAVVEELGRASGREEASLPTVDTARPETDA